MIAVQPTHPLDLATSLAFHLQGQDVPGQAHPILEKLSAVGWVDWIAIGLVGLFFLLGLFKGLLWQVCRVVTLVAAWFLAGHYGAEVENLVVRWGGFDPSASPSELPRFLAYVLIFVSVIVVLSVVLMLFQKFTDKEKVLSLGDRIGGAILGVGTGALAVVAILAGLFMFVPADSGVVVAAQKSESMNFSKTALNLLGDQVPPPVQRVFGLRDPLPPPEKGGDPSQPPPTKKLQPLQPKNGK